MLLAKPSVSNKPSSSSLGTSQEKQPCLSTEPPPENHSSVTVGNGSGEANGGPGPRPPGPATAPKPSNGGIPKPALGPERDTPARSVALPEAPLERPKVLPAPLNGCQKPVVAVQGMCESRTAEDLLDAVIVDCKVPPPACHPSYPPLGAEPQEPGHPASCSQQYRGGGQH